jgi:hypothetical protein
MAAIAMYRSPYLGAQLLCSRAPAAGRVQVTLLRILVDVHSEHGHLLRAELDDVKSPPDDHADDDEGDPGMPVLEVADDAGDRRPRNVVLTRTRPRARARQ